MGRKYGWPLSDRRLAQGCLKFYKTPLWSSKEKWDELLPNYVIKHVRDVEKMVGKKNDPLYGKQLIKPKDKCLVCCDASRVAPKAAVEIEGEIVEDMT